MINRSTPYVSWLRDRLEVFEEGLAPCYVEGVEGRG